jgi:hypothetical protein
MENLRKTIIYLTGYPVVGPRFKSQTSKMQSKSANHFIITFIDRETNEDINVDFIGNVVVKMYLKLNNGLIEHCSRSRYYNRNVQMNCLCDKVHYWYVIPCVGNLMEEESCVSMFKLPTNV